MHKKKNPLSRTLENATQEKVRVYWWTENSKEWSSKKSGIKKIKSKKERSSKSLKKNKIM